MDSTRNTINAETIAQMKDGVIILNFARGGLVNNADIKKALADGKVAKYVVDFADSETVNQPGIINIPHLGASTAESEDNCAVMAAQELADYLENGNILNSVTSRIVHFLKTISEELLLRIKIFRMLSLSLQRHFQV